MTPVQTKSIYLAKRNSRLTREEFPWRWRQHGLMGSSFPSLRVNNPEVAQLCNVFDREVLARSSLEYDGANLVTHARPEDAVGMWQNADVIDHLMPDELETFSTYVRHFTLVTRVEAIKDSTPSQFCVLTFLKAARGVSRELLSERVSALHDSVSADAESGTGRVVVNHVVDRPPGYDFDAVVELWFPDLATASRLPAALGGEFVSERTALCDEPRTITLVGRLNYVRSLSNT